jgi:hypothetical protein
MLLSSAIFTPNFEKLNIHCNTREVKQPLSHPNPKKPGFSYGGRILRVRGNWRV